MFRMKYPTQKEVHQAGFSMVELVMVIVIAGIIAVVALPKFAERSTFDSRAFGDQVKAALRYAQKSAIAQRHFVCVAFTANAITLTIDPVAPSTAHAAATCPGAPLETPFRVEAPGGVTMSGAADFSFDALGRPSAANSIAIAGIPAVIVEAETGYVH